MHSRKAIAAAIPPEAITPAVTAPVVMVEAVPAPADPDLEVVVLAVTLVQVEPTAVPCQAAGTRPAVVVEPLEARQPEAVERAPTAELLMLEMASAAAVAMAAPVEMAVARSQATRWAAMAATAAAEPALVDP